MILADDSNEGGVGGDGGEQRVYPTDLTPPSGDAKTLFIGGLNPTVTRSVHMTSCHHFCFLYCIASVGSFE